MKEEWKQFLRNLPYKKTELHKDEFKRKYQPEDLQLQVILFSNRVKVQLLVSAAELNQYKSLGGLKEAVKGKFRC